MDTVTIFTGTNIKNGDRLLNKDFNELSWWSDDYETLAHYYEGRAIEATIELDPEKQQDYIPEIQDLTIPISEYTYGFAEMNYPKGAIWYSFSSSYLKEHLISVKEIFPDLSMYNEE
jgi:hypothetical protein